jgi:hypothetical protein
MNKKLTLAVMGCATLLAASAGAASFTFDTAPGAKEPMGGSPVDAMAVFTTSGSTLTITLTDLLANPGNVAQLISDLSFNVTIGDLSTATLTSGKGNERTVNGNGTYSNGSTGVNAGWVFTHSGQTALLDVLSGPGHAGPSHLIIGPPGPGNVYANANGSIAGNGPHNPFLADSATFKLNIPGMSTDTIINNVVFSFGTTAGDDVPGVPGRPPTIPDGGTTVMLLGGALSGLALLRRKLS